MLLARDEDSTVTFKCCFKQVKGFQKSDGSNETKYSIKSSSPVVGERRRPAGQRSGTLTESVQSALHKTYL